MKVREGETPSPTRGTRMLPGFSLRTICHDADIERRVVHREEHLHVLVDGVAVARGHGLRKEPPVPGRQLGLRAIGPVLDD